MVCGAWQDASTSLTPGGIPVLKSGFTTNQINVQHQLDFECCQRHPEASTLIFRNVVAYSLTGSSFTLSVSTAGSGSNARRHELHERNLCLGDNDHLHANSRRWIHLCRMERSELAQEPVAAPSHSPGNSTVIATFNLAPTINILLSGTINASGNVHFGH